MMQIVWVGSCGTISHLVVSKMDEMPDRPGGA